MMDEEDTVTKDQSTPDQSKPNTTPSEEEGHHEEEEGGGGDDTAPPQSEADNHNGGEEVVNNGGDQEMVDIPPDYTTQKAEIQPLLSQKLKQGDEWYLVDQKWLKQWKKYTGFDSWDQYNAGSESYIPGPLDNSTLLEDAENNVIKDHLMEELDYALLPKPAWEKLTSWYKLTPQSRPICRRVVEYGTYVKHLKVEVYLINVKVCIHPHINETKQAMLSRADTIKQVQEKLMKMFELSDNTETRLWQRYMTNSYELMKDPKQTLADSGIYGGQMLMLETKTKEGKWPRDNSSSSYGSSYGSGATSSPSGYSSGGTSYTSSYNSWKQEPTTPGLCGLSNLGNTCFMNSALQCLSNTRALTEYFMGDDEEGNSGREKPFKKHINKDNPLGMKGALAETYGELLDMIWSGNSSSLAPRQFKMMIGKHAPQFSGYQQHDSHELLAFLLDGLHEDLNLVRKKPYVDMDIKAEGRQDKDIAAEAWHKYLLRNQSVIVRLFQGQLKSTLNCPKCSKTSRIFDPFMYMSLPLPIQKSRSVFVYLVRSDPLQELVRFRLVVPKSGSILELKQAMQKIVDIDPKKMVVIDVYHSRFHRVYYDKDAISQIMDRDDIYIYELAKPLGDEDWVPIPIYMREIKVQKTHSYYSNKTTTTTFGQVFGLPIVITVPRGGCTYRELYGIILTQCQRYVTVPVAVEKKGEEQIEEQEKDSNENTDKDCIEEMDVQSTKEPEPGEDTSGRGTADDDAGEPGTADTSQEEGGEPMDTDEDNDTKKDSDKEDEEENEKDNEGGVANNDLFKMIVVNSYGSQEVQKLNDDDRKLKLTSQTYVSCDWLVETKDKYYELKKVEEYIEDSSCEDVPEKRKAIDIYDCLDLFAHKEQLGEEDAWYCPNCKEFVQAFKKFDIWKLPEVLVIHLKRFSYSRWWRNKIESKVHFPLTGLDLSKYVVNEDHVKPIYDLFAVSNHFGGLGGGHYTAYCKNKVTGKWYSFDDSHVSETDDGVVCSSSSYVLFYARQTEGRTGGRRGVDRSLSSSFDDEVKQLTRPQERSTQQQAAMDTNRIEEEGENGGNDDNEEDPVCEDDNEAAATNASNENADSV